MGTGWYNESENKTPVWSRSGGTPLRRSPHRAKKVKQIHAGFNVVGIVAGIAAAFYAYRETESIALPIFMFFTVQTYIGRGLGDVVTDPHKVKRFVYFTLQPALMAGILYATYQWWGIMWLSAVLGFLLGLVLWQLLGIMLFPQIHSEELKDSQERMASGGA
jgi:hypothetical protein